MSDRVCSVEGCTRSLRCKGYCASHYERWRKTGSPLPPPRPVVTEKRCTGCGETKPLDGFHRNPGGVGGRESRCKVCCGLKYRAHAEELRARARERYWASEVERERRRAMHAAWYEQNRELVAERGREWRQAHPELVLAYSRSNRERNREAVNKRARETRKRDPERARRIGRKGESARRARIRGQFVEHVDPVVCFEAHGGMCGICGEVIRPGADYHIDHIVPLSRGGEHSYTNTQPAHPSCNIKKHNRLDYVEVVNCAQP